MWRPLKEAIIECIEFAEEDPGNDISIVTFHDNIRDIFTRNVSSEGKADLKKYVETYKYQSHKYTNIVDPINKFYSVLGDNNIKYMFLFTDGENDHPETKPRFIHTLDSWTDKTAGQNAYGFYVLVHPNADKPNIRKSIESQDNLWIVPDAKVRIKICSLPSSIKYNVRDEKGPKDIYMRGKYSGASGELNLTSNDQYYDVICSDKSISNGKLSFEVKKKNGVIVPENHTINLSPVIANADQYTFVGPKDIQLTVSNLPERSLNLLIEGNNLGKATHHDSFLISKEKFKPASKKVGIVFSDQAKKENSSALMKVYFVDKKGQPVSSASQNLSLSINDNVLSGDSFMLSSDIDSLSLSVNGTTKTNSGSYYGRIEIIPNNLDNYSINGVPDVYIWKVRYEQKWNPLKLGLSFLILMLVAAFLVWMLILKPMFYPKFGSIQKTFNIPGMAPLIVKFKGARKVVIAASHQKKQSGWDKFWKGKVLYKTHPAFTSPVTMRPAKGRRIIAKVDCGTYRIAPNPIPGVGSATIDNLLTNTHITIH